VRELHAVSLMGMAPHLRDELVLLLGAGLEPAVAVKNLVHVLEPRLGIGL